MLRENLILLSAVVLLAGCERVVDAAEHARIKTEHMADAAQSASNAREAKIFAQAAQMIRRENRDLEGPRYEARKDGAGDSWTIYDNRTNAPATVGTQVETGLSHAQAAARMAHMVDDNEVPTFRR
jgi:hypothetical protein